MIGVALTAVGTGLEECAATIGKRQVLRHAESVPTMGVLHLIVGAVVFLGIVVVHPSSFVLASASLPILVPRLALEIFQAHVTLTAIARADRSTFSFLRMLTIPVLLGVDVLLGYSLRTTQFVGALVVMAVLTFALLERGIRARGAGLVVVSALNSALTISLYKYTITHYNSVVAEQLVSTLVLLGYFAVLARVRAHEHPLAFLRRPMFLVESLAQGVGGVIEGFAYAFAPAAVIVAAKRSTAVLWSIGTGNHVFHESHLAVKMVTGVGLIVGIVLLAMGG
ncbi:hypothetical protein HYV74_01700 [Candidatus Uhrbacteria bacterium]|nr:hypothetical protein [Candidatus Uhrbacteria bacterium]